MKLRYTLEAAAELEGLLDYVAKKSPQGRRMIQQRIQALTLLLLQHPRMGKQMRNPVLRRVSASPYPYLIFYQATKDEIIVHGVRHGARNPATMPER